MFLARVHARFPWAWRDESYKTRDHVIPFPVFWLYAGMLGSALAFDRVQHAKAVAQAIALSFGNKDGGLPESVRGDLVDAYLLPPE